MLKAGFSRVDITPPLGTDLAGYFRRRFADGVLDPLYLNAIAVGNDAETLVMIAVDFLGITMEHIAVIKKKISAALEIREECILIAALHEHTSPCLANPDVRPTVDSIYLDVFYRKCTDVARMAIDDMSEAELGTAQAQTDTPIAFVRRYRLNDNTVATNPSEEDCARIVGRCAEADNTVRLLRFQRKEKKDIALVNFSTHPDVIHGTKISADWPGFTRTCVEQALGEVSCIFFTGPQGDSNHVDYCKPKAERNDGYEHSKRMGRTVAAVVQRLWEHTTPHTGDELFAKTLVIYNRTNLEGVEKYEECRRFLDDARADRISPKPHITDLAYASRVVNLRTASIFRPIPLTVFGIADVAFIGFGGEAFTEYGAIARALLPDRFVVCAVCANGYEGYFPTKKAFLEGGYEASGSLFTPSLEDEIVDALSRMVEPLKKS